MFALLRLFLSPALFWNSAVVVGDSVISILAEDDESGIQNSTFEVLVDNILELIVDINADPEGKELL